MKLSKITAFLALCAGFSALSAGDDRGEDWNPYQYRHEPRDLYEGAFLTGAGAAGWRYANLALKLQPSGKWGAFVRAPFIASTALGALALGRYYTSNWKRIKNYYNFEYNRRFKK